MHAVMAIGRRRTKAMIADVCIKLEVILYRILYRSRESERVRSIQSEGRKIREEVAGLRMPLGF